MVWHSDWNELKYKLNGTNAMKISTPSFWYNAMKKLFLLFDKLLVRIILDKYIQSYENDVVGTEIEQIKHKPTYALMLQECQRHLALCQLSIVKWEWWSENQKWNKWSYDSYSAKHTTQTHPVFHGSTSSYTTNRDEKNIRVHGIQL